MISIKPIAKDKTPYKKEGEEAGIKLGIKKGEEIGIKKGEELGLKKIAKAMLKHGDDENYIAQITGLNIEEIHKLKE